MPAPLEMAIADAGLETAIADAGLQMAIGDAGLQMAFGDAGVGDTASPDGKPRPLATSGGRVHRGPTWIQSLGYKSVFFIERCQFFFLMEDPAIIFGIAQNVV